MILFFLLFAVFITPYVPKQFFKFMFPESNISMMNKSKCVSLSECMSYKWLLNNRNNYSAIISEAQILNDVETSHCENIEGREIKVLCPVDDTLEEKILESDSSYIDDQLVYREKTGNILFKTSRSGRGMINANDYDKPVCKGSLKIWHYGYSSDINNSQKFRKTHTHWLEIS